MSSESGEPWVSARDRRRRAPWAHVHISCNPVWFVKMLNSQQLTHEWRSRGLLDKKNYTGVDPKQHASNTLGGPGVEGFELEFEFKCVLVFWTRFLVFWYFSELRWIQFELQTTWYIILIIYIYIYIYIFEWCINQSIIVNGQCFMAHGSLIAARPLALGLRPGPRPSLGHEPWTIDH